MPHTPNLETQRAAMRKLDFLIGRWTGEARMARGPGQYVDMIQTEDAQYKLDGLVLMIEGIGRNKADGTPVLQALGIISYDDESSTYRMRAFNDGRFLETDIKLLDDGNSLSWGLALGEIKTSTVLRIDEQGRWTEDGELKIGQRPPVKFLELAVLKVKT